MEIERKTLVLMQGCKEYAIAIPPKDQEENLFLEAGKELIFITSLGRVLTPSKNLISSESVIPIMEIREEIQTQELLNDFEKAEKIFNENHPEITAILFSKLFAQIAEISKGIKEIRDRLSKPLTL